MMSELYFGGSGSPPGTPETTLILSSITTAPSQTHI